MAYPVFSKTHQWSVDNAQAAQGSAKLDNAQLLSSIFTRFLGLGTQPFTCDYSCGTVAGTKGDGVNRWTSGTSLLYASPGTAHSWMVIKPSGIISGAEILFTLNAGAAQGNIWQILYSPSVGFTGGSTTADPTASDSIAVTPVGSQFCSLATDLGLRWSIDASTDGQCIRAWAFAGGNLIFGMLIEGFANLTSGVTSAIFIYCPSGAAGTNNAQFSASNLGASFTSPAIVNGVKVLTSMTVEGLLSSGASNCLPLQQTIVNSWGSAWPNFPVGLYANTLGGTGKIGTFQDLWAPSLSNAIADNEVDSVNSRQWVLLGAIWVPYLYGATIHTS